MKKTILLIALLIAARTVAQTNGDPVFFYYVSPGIKDSKTYASLVLDGLMSTNGSGGFGMIPKSTFLTPAQGNTAYQPLNATLTALAALTTTSYGRGLLSLADASAARTYIGLAKSTGGNLSADAGKVLEFRSQGEIVASSTNLAAVTGSASGNAPGVAGETGGALSAGVTGYTPNGGAGVLGTSGTGPGVEALSSSGPAFRGTSDTDVGLHLNVTDAGNTVDLAWIHRDDNLGVEIRNDGGLDWTSPTGSQTTATALPVFSAANKGVVPASGGGTTNFLRADGSFAVPPGSGGTVTSVSGTSPIASTGGTTPAISIANAAADGSTKGAAAFTAADFNSLSGVVGIDYTNAQKATAAQPGLLTASDWFTFNGKQGAITFGTGVQTALGVNVGSAGAPVLFNGAGGTPSSLVGTNITGTASGLSIGGNAATATALQTGRTINGTTFDGTANITVTAAAGTLTGTTLNSTVVTSSLTSAAGGAFGTAAYVNTGTSGANVPTITQADARYVQQSIVAAKGDIVGASANDTPAITSVGTDGQALQASSAAASGLAWAWHEEQILFFNVSTTCTDMPAAVAFLGASTGPVRSRPIALTNKTQVRLFTYVGTAGFAGSKSIIRYRTSYSATASDYLPIGASSTDLSCSLTSGTQWVDSGWIDITASAKGDVFIASLSIDGNGAADPVIQQVVLWTR